MWEELPSVFNRGMLIIAIMIFSIIFTFASLGFFIVLRFLLTKTMEWAGSQAESTNTDSYYTEGSTSNEISETDNIDTVETTEEDITENEVKSEVSLGTIPYEDLDTSDSIQAKAQYLGCSIEDDGEKIYFIPEISATIQNLNLYISCDGNEGYFDDFLDGASEVSLQTGGKPVNILDGNGEIIIIAENGKII